jgi:hypothetical protein
MRVANINNNYTNPNNQKQPNFTALRKINMSGMFDSEKAVVLEMLPNIKKVAEQVENMDIDLVQLGLKRSFKVTAYKTPTGDEALIEKCAEGGIPHLMDAKSAKSWVQESLTSLVNKTVERYFGMFPEQKPQTIELLPVAKSNISGCGGSCMLM